MPDRWKLDDVKVAGVTFEGRQEALREVAVGDWLAVVREPDNAYDANACGVWRVDRHGHPSVQVGFLPREVSAEIGPMCDSGYEVWAHVSAVLGGGERSIGLRVTLKRRPK
ncbi:MAG: HIRAN domain-containing protein [Gemmatimonadaceae bacterium]|jgi:hypothetical protein